MPLEGRRIRALRHVLPVVIGVIRAIRGYSGYDVLARTLDAADANREAFGVRTERSEEQRGRIGGCS